MTEKKIYCNQDLKANINKKRGQKNRTRLILFIDYELHLKCCINKVLYYLIGLKKMVTRYF